MKSRLPYAYHSSEDRDARLQLINFAHVLRRHPTPASRSYNRHLWGLDYHFMQAGEYSLNSRDWHPRETGTAQLYAPGTPHWERSAEGDIPFCETYVVLRAQGIAGLEALVAPGNGFARFLDPAGLLDTRFEALFDAVETGRHWRIQGATCAVIDCLLTAQADETVSLYTLAPPAPAEQSLAERVDGYIREHFASSVTLADMARAAGVSRSALTHRFHEETGSSPIARLRDHRLEMARVMVLRGEPLKVVAANTGFYDEYYLSRVFRRRFGLPPRRYARQAGGTSSA